MKKVGFADKTDTKITIYYYQHKVFSIPGYIFYIEYLSNFSIKKITQ